MEPAVEDPAVEKPMVAVEQPVVEQPAFAVEEHAAEEPAVAPRPVTPASRSCVVPRSVARSRSFSVRSVSSCWVTEL